MKTLLSIIILFSSLAQAQDTCHLNVKIKLVKPKDCQPCSQIYAATNKRGTFTYLWSTGNTNDSIRVCDTTVQTYSVLVTDSAGCTSTDSIQTSNSKKCVDVCHRRGNGRKTTWSNLCISYSAVQAHLLHGDSLGCCGANQPSHIINVHSNNGNHNGHRKLEIDFASFEVEKTVITLTGIDGKQIVVYEGVTDGETVSVTQDLPNGIYIISMQTGETITSKVILLE